MSRVWLPVHCLLLPGHGELRRSTYCYLRYKFYDNDAFCSHTRHPSFGDVEEEGLVTVDFQQSRTVELRCSQPLMWYLREEKLEVQVWAAFTKDKTQRPRDTDRLVGSAFIDLSSFAKTSKQKLTISGKTCSSYSVFRSTLESNSRFLVLQECFRCLGAQQQICRGLLSESTWHLPQASPLWRTWPNRWTLRTRKSSYWKTQMKQIRTLRPENHRANPVGLPQTTRPSSTQKQNRKTLSPRLLSLIGRCTSV